MGAAIRRSYVSATQLRALPLVCDVVHKLYSHGRSSHVVVERDWRRKESRVLPFVRVNLPAKLILGSAYRTTATFI